MSDTTFVNSVTLTDASWFQDINNLYYVTLGAPATISALKRAVNPTLVAEVASTSGTSIDFTGIPTGVKRITVMFKGVSTNGTSLPIIQIGDSGGIEASGYLGACSHLTNAAAVITSAFTTGFGVTGSMGAASVIHGSVVLSLENSAAFSWVSSANIAFSDAAQVSTGGGSKSTSAELDRVRITTVNGTDAFDAGAISITYE